MQSRPCPCAKLSGGFPVPHDDVLTPQPASPPGLDFQPRTPSSPRPAPPPPPATRVVRSGLRRGSQQLLSNVDGQYSPCFRECTLAAGMITIWPSGYFPYSSEVPSRADITSPHTTRHPCGADLSSGLHSLLGPVESRGLPGPFTPHTPCCLQRTLPGLLLPYMGFQGKGKAASPG